MSHIPHSNDLQHVSAIPPALRKDQLAALAQQDTRAAQSQEPVQDAVEEEEPQGTGPVGQGDWVVKEGDCISSIANATGHFWETIWNDGANAELRGARDNPNVLLPKDRVTVPELMRKDESRPSEQHHRFRRKGEPVPLRLRLLEEPERDLPEEEEATGTGAPPEAAGQAQGGQPPPPQASQPSPSQGSQDEEEQSKPVEDVPRANVPYVLDVEGTIFDGTTDADGQIEVLISPAAKEGTLTLYPGTDQEEVISVMLGHMAPITEISGVKDRLLNLGFSPGSDDEDEDEKLAEALRAFQAKAGLDETGEPDQPTRDKLVECVGN